VFQERKRCDARHIRPYSLCNYPVQPQHTAVLIKIQSILFVIKVLFTKKARQNSLTGRLCANVVYDIEKEAL
jgi:hypothetical protein